MSANNPSPATSSRIGTRHLVQGALTHVTGIAAVLSAWGYLAGYTYRDQFLTNFGLSFNAVNSSTIETLVQGYYVTIYAISEGAWPLIKLIVLETLAAILVFGFLSYSVRSGWGWAVWIKTALQGQTTWPDRVLPWSLMIAASLLFIIGAVPAGSLAADYDIKAFESNIRLGYHRHYKVGTTVRHGLLLAQDSNVSWLLMSDELVPVDTKQLHPLAPFGRKLHRHAAHAGPAKAGSKPKTSSVQ